MNQSHVSPGRLRLLSLILILPLMLSCGSPPAVTQQPESKVKEQDSTVDPAKDPAPPDDKGKNPAEAAKVKEPDEAKVKPEDGAKPHKKHKANRLAKETSPYLLLHAHNPVDWYPWGPEALEKAKKEGKVIFLSIGYSSCHWCHVMERESFLDEEIAAIMNDNFVCIKIDREERPDIDTIYMTSLQVYNEVTGSGRGGGWPLSMFLTPEGEPFFGGTYFPARDGDRGATTGFLTIIKRVRDLWKDKQSDIREDAKTLSGYVKQQLAGRRRLSLESPGQATLDQLAKDLGEQFDPDYGGFGFNPENPRRPKFPEPSNLFFLIDRIQRARAAGGDPANELKLLTTSLDGMARGGIWDHVGGGFHRYSVDRFWQIPHFEKMLYDNAQLASVYTEAYLLTKQERYRGVVVGMLDFVLSEMTDKSGGFLSALDAETEDEEGKFYRWEKEQVEKLLEEDEFKLFAEVYGLDAPPNFEGEYYAPQLSVPLAKLAESMELDEQQLEEKLAPIRKKLFAARSKRPRPLTDDKILTSWNGLMIRGFADSGRGLKEPRFIEAAVRAADFALNNLRTEDGRLLRTYSRGQAKLNAYLDDYAFLTDGLIALHRATGDEKWLLAADELTAKQIELFWDEEQSGFFFTSDDHESLLARSKSYYDSAEPSGNSVAAQNLIYLGQKRNKPEFMKHARDTIGTASDLLSRAPSAAPRMVVALAALLELEPEEKDPKEKDLKQKDPKQKEKGPEKGNEKERDKEPVKEKGPEKGNEKERDKEPVKEKESEKQEQKEPAKEKEPKPVEASEKTKD